MKRAASPDPAQLELTLKPRRKPAYTAREGNVKVPVYKYGDARWCVAWRQVAGGPRLRVTFESKAEAIKKADETARAIANSQADVTTLSSATRDDYRLAMQELPAGIPLHAAVQEYAAARALVAPHTLLEAAQYFARERIERKAVPATAAIVAELLVQLRDDRRDERRYIEPLARDLGGIVTAFPDLAAATEVDLRAYLGGLRTSRAVRDRETKAMRPAGSAVSARRRDNVRDAAVLLMRFAAKRGYLPAGETPAEAIPRLALGGMVTTYTPQQMEALLTYFAEHDPEWLPWAAIGAFAGLRSSEIMRLEWKMVKWTKGVIAVPRAIARKIRISRMAPMMPPLTHWLQGWHTAAGWVIPRKWANLEKACSRAIGRMCEALEWTAWDNNALRHSFGSNHLARVKSYAQVAVDMGNSPGQVREDYNDPKDDEEAEMYCQVMPPAEIGKIVRIA